MKYFEIRSDLPEDDRLYGVVIYNRAADEYIIELPDDLDYNSAPILLDTSIKNGSRTVGPFVSRLWIEQRVVPPDRQNIGMILADWNLDHYDEHKLLVISDGRCAQDDLYLKPIPAKSMPIDITDRLKKRIKDFVILDDEQILLFFKDAKTKICDLKQLKDTHTWLKIISINENYYKSARLITSGYGIAWDNERQISCETLYKIGVDLPINYSAFTEFVKQRTLSTTATCNAIGCSRQNVNDLVKRGKLHPIKDMEKSKLFTKAELDEYLNS